MKNINEEYKPENIISNVGLYSILVSGGIIFIAGVYVSANSDQHWDAAGWDSENSPIHLNGPFMIILGILISIYPAYYLVKRNKTIKDASSE